MENVKFYKGEETGEVIEKKDYGESIFADNYKQAFGLLRDIVVSGSNTSKSNIIAFCGDRGEGKSSCMRSFLYAISQKESFEEISSSKDLQFDYNSFEMLDLIDPAFFDQNHNLIELMLGQMFNKLKYEENIPNVDKTYERNELMKKFSESMTCLNHLEREKTKMFDELSELGNLASGMRLAKCLSDLFEQYLKYKGKKRLVIAIDDLDLNMTEAYKMSEQLRKYLNNKHCIIMIALKTQQLVEAVASAIKSDIRLEVTNDDVTNMAIKYVTKLIPYCNRVTMPGMILFYDSPLYLYKSRQSDDQEVETGSLKETVVKLIFRKTRYLFYNAKSNVSRIVPENLRNLRQLIGMLLAMPDPDVSSTLRSNQQIFKNYFFYYWTLGLDQKYKDIVKELIEETKRADINAFVIQTIKGYQNSFLEVSTRDILLQKILATDNCNYNISVGDVLYAINCLESNTVDSELKDFIFFLKSYYSMRLYELYDFVTDNINTEMYPLEEKDTEIYHNEKRFNGTNALQRFVAGSMVAYNSSDIIANSRDRRSVKASALFSKLKSIGPMIDVFRADLVDGKLPAEKEEVWKTFKNDFRLCEYFILNTIRTIDANQKHNTEVDRANVKPYYLGKYNIERGYLVFDVMSVFYNLTNPCYSYHRFDDIADIYDFANSQDWTLLGCLKQKSNAPHDIHKLMSNAVVRNVDVHSSLVESLADFREKDKTSGSDKIRLRELYKSIMRNCRMKLYHEDQYEMSFTFLQAFVDFLKDIEDVTFDSVFSIDNSAALPNVEVLFENSLSTIKKEILGKTVVKRISSNNEDIFNNGDNAVIIRGAFTEDQRYNREATITRLHQIVGQLTIPSRHVDEEVVEDEAPIEVVEAVILQPDNNDQIE